MLLPGSDADRNVGRFETIKSLLHLARNQTLTVQCGFPRRAAMEPAASCSMASNRAIMPRADSTSSTVGPSHEGLPSPRTSFQTMLKVTLTPGQGHGAAASTARFCCSSRDALVLCLNAAICQGRRRRA
jgi:hypothetical protein